MNNFWISVKMTVVLTVLTGLAYPLLIAGAARVLFPWQAQGSPVERDGKIVGSALIGQNFASPRYFQPRPSAAGDKGYDASNSSGSNLGPTNKALIDGVRTRLAQVAESDGIAKSQVPIDLVTASGSGLDPHLTVAAMLYQADRVAAARGMDPSALRALVEQHVESAVFGLLGQRRVNVLAVNLALDAQ